MMDEQFFFSTTSSLFDTYLVYGIIGLLIFIAIIGLIVLLATSCCCCYSCLSPSSCCLCCYHSRRHSSYKLRSRAKHLEGAGGGDSKKNGFIRRHPSDVADFSQLYDSCPHLINSKAMTTTSTNMNTSCTTIDSLISPISPCSSFRSFIESGISSTDNKLAPVLQSELGNSIQKNNINTDKTDNAPSSSAKGVSSRPFSYIKNTNDRAQILRRFTQHDRSVPAAAVSIDVTRISSSESDNSSQTNSNSTNVYETVLLTTNNNNNNNNSSTSDVSTPIYETEWTHNLRQLMMATTSSIENEGISVIELPVPPPDLVPSTKESSDYFQQQSPYDKFLASRPTISDSMRRTNMLNHLKDNTAFLY